MTNSCPRRRGLALVVAAVVGASCALFGSVDRQEYAVTAVNGAPVPVTVPRGTLNGQPYAERILSGKLVLFNEGGFAWELTTLYLIGGRPDPRFPTPLTARHTGAYDRLQDTLKLSWYFEAVRVSHESWAVRDVSGFFGQSTYTVTRQ